MGIGERVFKRLIGAIGEERAGARSLAGAGSALLGDSDASDNAALPR